MIALEDIFRSTISASLISSLVDNSRPIMWSGNDCLQEGQMHQNAGTDKKL